LLNATIAWFASPSLAFYAGYTEGLEESPVAPDIAINRDEAPPALRTRQIDGGVRWTIRRGMRLVLGAFQVEKPYFNLETSGVFRQLGDVTHTGVEFSFIGQLTPEFLTVIGTSVIDPRVAGAAVDAGIVGPRPVASFRRLSTAVVQYRPSWWAAASFDLIVESSSDRVANSAGTLFIPERTTVSLGARYRFRVGEAPANLRILLANVSDLYGYGNTASGLFVLNQPRRLSVTFTVDW
jgi:iron complex outermembrane receptor protein